jgi:hypothetical protein
LEKISVAAVKLFDAATGAPDEGSKRREETL